MEKAKILLKIAQWAKNKKGCNPVITNPRSIYVKDKYDVIGWKDNYSYSFEIVNARYKKDTHKNKPIGSHRYFVMDASVYGKIEIEDYIGIIVLNKNGLLVEKRKPLPISRELSKENALLRAEVIKLQKGKQNE